MVLMRRITSHDTADFFAEVARRKGYDGKQELSFDELKSAEREFALQFKTGIDESRIETFLMLNKNRIVTQARCVLLSLYEIEPDGTRFATFQELACYGVCYDHAREIPVCHIYSRGVCDRDLDDDPTEIYPSCSGLGSYLRRDSFSITYSHDQCAHFLYVYE